MATRLYLLTNSAEEPKPNVNQRTMTASMPQVVSMSYGGGQDATGSASAVCYPCQMSTVAGSTNASGLSSYAEPGSAHYVKVKTFVSPALAVQTISSTGSVTVYADFQEGNSNQNMYPLPYIYVWKSDDTGMRGSALFNITSSLEANTTLATPQTFFTTSALASNVTTSLGDVLVLELYAWDSNTKTATYEHGFGFNGAAASGYDSYIELSQTLAWKPTVIQRTSATLYNIRKSVSILRKFFYDIKVYATRTRIFQYNVRNFVSRTRGYLYTIREKVSRTHSALYNIRVLVSKTERTLYNIRVLISRKWTTLYDIKKLITVVRIGIYNVGGIVKKALISLYNIRGLVDAKRIVLYNIRGVVSRARTFSYSLRGLVSRTNAHLYNLRKTISVLSRHLYDIKKVVAHPFVAVYNLKNFVTRVRIFVYNMAGAARVTLMSYYNIRGSISIKRTYSYNIRALVASTKGFLYRIRSSASKTITFIYGVGGILTKKFGFLYNIRTKTTTSASFKYNIRGSIGRILTSAYNLIGRVYKRFSTSYKIEATWTRQIILMKEALARYYRTKLLKAVNDFETSSLKLTDVNITGVTFVPKKRNQTLYGTTVTIQFRFKSGDDWEEEKD